MRSVDVKCILLVLALTFYFSKCAHSARYFTSGLNASCTYNHNCIEGLTCIDSICSPLGTLGGVCDDYNDCVGLRCINSTCTNPSSSGGPCAGYLDEGDCAAELVCINGVCTAPNALNGPCHYFWHCRGSLTCIAKRCAEKSRAGGKCDNHVDCTRSICRNGECKKDIGLIVTCLAGFFFVVIVLVSIECCVWRKWS